MVIVAPGSIQGVLLKGISLLRCLDCIGKKAVFDVFNIYIYKLADNITINQVDIDKMYCLVIVKVSSVSGFQGV